MDTILFGTGCVGIGLVIGFLLNHLIVAKPLVQGYVRLRYDGFRPEAPPVRPKLVPQPPHESVRED